MGAPFVRFVDKLSFIFGVFILIIHTYLMGRYPNDYIYYFYVYIITALVIFRLFIYKRKGWHYYLFDFCYFGNVIIMTFLLAYPKDDVLMKTAFNYSNGIFGIAVAAFRNSMVFHNIDNLTSISIHLIPLSCIWNLRWHTIPYEATLPPEERHFASIDPNESFTDTMYGLFVIPTALYMLWVFIYSLKMFVFSSKRIQERNYETAFIYYSKKPSIKKIFDWTGPRIAPVIFMSCHIGFYLGSCIIAVVSY